MPQNLSKEYTFNTIIQGLGKALVESYLTKPDNVVIAAVRDPTHTSSKSLYAIPKSPSSTLIVVKVDSISETDAATAVSQMQSRHNVQALDVVIANAGIARVFPKVDEAHMSDLLEHYQVNAIGTMLLYQATLPLLKRSHRSAKFVVMSSSAGTIEDQDKVPVPNAAYGPSKAALNWIVRKIHLENENLIAFPMHPG